MRIRLTGMLFLVLAVLVLAGCHKWKAKTTVSPNGSGELQMEVGFSAEERANLEKQNNNAQDFCNISKPPKNVTVSEEQRGDETWCINITPFKGLDELRSLYLQRKDITINRLEIAGGKFYYDVDMDTLSEESDFSALKEITWTVALPGIPISHNADQVDGSTLTWNPSPKSGIVNLRAESEIPSGHDFPACGAAVIGLIAGGILLHRRRMSAR